MALKFDVWRQKIQRYPFRSAAIILVGVALIVVCVLGYWLNWDWTGLGPYDSSVKSSTFQRGKTLWDWLQLLVIPVVLAVGGFWLSQIQKGREEATTADNQQEAALQMYINAISELLLEKKLSESSSEEEVRTVARVRTLTVLPRLDGRRKRDLLLFLFDAGLIDREVPVIKMDGADLSGADLSNVHLYRSKWTKDGNDQKESVTTVEADLRGVNLRRAHLNGANLSGVRLGAKGKIELSMSLSKGGMMIADLRGATLVKADLSGADLGGVDLSGANLREAILSGAYLRCADLSLADLRGASLDVPTWITESYDQEEDAPDPNEWKGADLRGATLRRADLRGATLWRANLGGADLCGANLSGVDLGGADLGGAEFNRSLTRLLKVNLERANLKGVKGITPEKLEGQAESLKGATMPDGSKHP